MKPRALYIFVTLVTFLIDLNMRFNTSLSLNNFFGDWSNLPSALNFGGLRIFYATLFFSFFYRGQYISSASISNVALNGDFGKNGGGRGFTPNRYSV